MEMGTTSRTRELAGAGALVAGAAVMCGTTLGGLAGYQNLLVLGAIAVVAWLIDGTGRRYMGVGLTAAAVGLGLTLGNGLGVQSVEHGLVYPLIGIALLAISRLNPREVQGAGALLVIIGSIVWGFAAGLSYNLGWGLAVILAIWGIARIATILRGTLAAGSEQQQPAGGAHQERSEVAGTRS
jgi:hypothetical protein